MVTTTTAGTQCIRLASNSTTGLDGANNNTVRNCNLSCWWSLGAVGTWQVAGIGVAQAERYNLFEVPLHEQVKALVDLNGGDIDRIRPWLRQNHNIVNFGFLSEANTYAWRGDDVPLASVQDHRFGAMRNQAHSWQAAIDADALVFTNHPVTDRDESTDWDDDGRPGYWTGEASMPRSAQYERAAIHIYQLRRRASHCCPESCRPSPASRTGRCR